MSKNILKTLLLVQVVLALFVTAFMIFNPIAFLKTNTIQIADMQQMMQLKNAEAANVSKVISQIPYRSGQTFTVEPKARFDEILASGRGNCSNKSYALAYYLQQQGVNYNIVHLLIPNKFLDGEGHVAIQTTYNLDSTVYEGVVDMYEGGLPSYQNRFINVNDMMTAGFNADDFKIYGLNQKVNDRSRYYLEFLDSAVVGLTPSSEVNAHFDWISSIFIPLGNRKLEKFVYDGLALEFGRHPKIYVSEADYQRLFTETSLRRFLNIAALWIIRILNLTFPLTILFFVVRTKKS